ncbi:MAG: flagellar protein FlaG [Clostridium sp.]|nr:flagellar protein FlaG [Clostridium sp.]
MGVNGVNLGNEINKLESTKEEISSTTIINELMNNDNIQVKKAQETKSEKEKYNNKELKKAVDEVNKYLVKDKTHAEYSVHEVFNRIMIKIIDDKTDKVVLEVPPKKLIDMAAKLCKLAGVIVDKRA